MKNALFLGAMLLALAIGVGIGLRYLDQQDEDYLQDFSLSSQGCPSTQIGTEFQTVLEKTSQDFARSFHEGLTVRQLTLKYSKNQDGTKVFTLYDIKDGLSDDSVAGEARKYVITDQQVSSCELYLKCWRGMTGSGLCK